MRKITEIKTQKKKKNRVNLYLDGEFYCSLYMKTIVDHHLYKGKELSEANIEEIKKSDDLKKAKDRARHYLSYRPRSTGEIKKYLRDKGFNIDIIQKIIEDFKSTGLLNDSKFAKMWIKNRNINNPKGHYALRMELKEKGVDDRIIEEALQLADEEKNIRKAANKAIRKYKNKDDAKNKIISYLSRRGFPGELSINIVNELYE